MLPVSRFCFTPEGAEPAETGETQAGSAISASSAVKNVFFIVGPTASGKSDLAAEVAARCGAEIVSGDAFQIYRGLPLLSARC